MTSPAPGDQPPRRAYHGRVIVFTLGFFLVVMAVVDGFSEQGVSLWTVAKALIASVVALAYLYLVRYPRRRRLRRPDG
jgi:hypothetical protein